MRGLLINVEIDGQRPILGSRQAMATVFCAVRLPD